VTAVLVTGFEPFGGAEVNPSQLLVEALVAEPPARIELAAAVLPVSYARAADALGRAIAAAEPELVVCFGQADGRPAISLERIALNLDDAESADNDGLVAAGAIDLDGPVAYRSTLPVDEIVAALRAGGIPGAASHDAGGFLCNHVFYALMQLLERELPSARGGFVHVPLLPEQALTHPAATMPLETLVRGARILLATAGRVGAVA
jgi:pyroglutamyl-peptidase